MLTKQRTSPQQNGSMSSGVTASASPPLEQTPPLAWHAQDTKQILKFFETSPERGLPDDVALNRLNDFGPNILNRAKKESLLKLIWRQINNPLIFVLLGSAVLAFAMEKPIDGAVVLGVVVLNAVVGFVQEYRAGRANDSLSTLVPEYSMVLRQGHKRQLDATQLVPGDIVELQAGDKVPADIRLFFAKSLNAIEASLTGESVPNNKQTRPVSADAGLGDRTSMVYGGTLVTSGTGTGVVVATGMRTELGRISRMINEATPLETPLTRALGRVASILTVSIVLVSIALFLVGLYRGFPMVDSIIAAVTLAVAAIPEGLPAIITIALAIGVRRMAQRNAVVRYLPSVETLGSTTVICSDKTGTLTRGEMTVQELWVKEGSYHVKGIGYAPEGKVLDAEHNPVTEPSFALNELLRAGILCNDATLHKEKSAWTISGDPTEGALLVSAAKAGFQAKQIAEAYPRKDTIPFDSEKKWMATLHQNPDGQHTVYLKGAPEVILRKCKWQDAAQEESIHREVNRMASHGMRILAFAAFHPQQPLSHLDENQLEDNLQFLGLQGMIDPPRTEVMDSINACKSAGIRVKMITGDHKTTALAIGETLGIADDGTALTGDELTKVPEDQFSEKITKCNIFARVAPEHKIKIVRTLQKQKHIVAMTGDGVNDAPALKQANIGVAMGIAGTAVSREAAAIVLADDNFASIRAAVEEGRRVYDNLIKSLAFVLPTNLGEGLLILIAVLFFPIINKQPVMPILPVQILWVNLVATVTLALPLAFEAMEPDVMRRPPRDPDEPVLSRFVLMRTALVAVIMTAGATGLFLYELKHATTNGLPLPQAIREAQTSAVTTVILFQIFYVLNCRSLKDTIFSIGLFSNNLIYVGIAVILLLQLAFVYLPFMNTLFQSQPMSGEAWLKSFAVAILIFPIVGIEKWFRRKKAIPSERKDSP